MQTPDQKTRTYIDKVLATTAVLPEKLDELACNLVKKEVYMDNLRRLQNEVYTLKQKLERATVSDKTRTYPKTLSESDTANDQEQTKLKTPHCVSKVGDTSEELRQEIEDLKRKLSLQKEQFEKSDKDYKNVKQTLEDAQEEVFYWRGMYNKSRATYKMLSEEIDELQKRNPQLVTTQQLEEKTNENEELRASLAATEFDLTQIHEQVVAAEEKLMQAEAEKRRCTKRENELKDQLGLEHSASEEEVRMKVKLMKEQAEGKTEKINDIYQQWRAMQEENEKLEDRVFNLTRQRDSLAFQLRQTENKYHRLKMQRFPHMRKIQERREAEGNQGPRPRADDRGKTQLSALKLRFPETSQTSRPRVAAPGAGQPTTGFPPLPSQPPPILRMESKVRFCLLCQREFLQGVNSGTCSHHYLPVSQGKWACCNNDRAVKAGCIRLCHLYFAERDGGEAILVTTDGVNRLKIKVVPNIL